MLRVLFNDMLMIRLFVLSGGNHHGRLLQHVCVMLDIHLNVSMQVVLYICNISSFDTRLSGHRATWVWHFFIHWGQCTGDSLGRRLRQKGHRTLRCQLQC